MQKASSASATCCTCGVGWAGGFDDAGAWQSAQAAWRPSPLPPCPCPSHPTRPFHSTLPLPITAHKAAHLGMPIRLAARSHRGMTRLRPTHPTLHHHAEHQLRTLACRSASEYTATVGMPRRPAVASTRHAISPRLATRSLAMAGRKPGTAGLVEELKARRPRASRALPAARDRRIQRREAGGRQVGAAAAWWAGVWARWWAPAGAALQCCKALLSRKARSSWLERQQRPRRAGARDRVTRCATNAHQSRQARGGPQQNSPRPRRTPDFTGLDHCLWYPGHYIACLQVLLAVGLSLPQEPLPERLLWAPRPLSEATGAHGAL